jgi:HSP90 family molecular chaperone
MQRLVTILTAILLLVPAANVLAQDSEGNQQQLEQLAESEESLVDEDVEGMADQEKLSRAESKISSSRQSLEETNALLEKAREQEKDVMKINCINDKQAAIKGFLKVAEQSYVKLKDAVSGNDSEEADHHYTLISVSKQKIDSLAEEARMCAGEVQRYAEETRVEVDVDDDVADTDGYVPPDPGRITTLPELTPYQ